MKKTAVEFLIKELIKEKILTTNILIHKHFTTEFIIAKAKEMEKEQIEDAYIKGCQDNYSIDIVENSEQYYNEKFKNK